MTAEPGPERAPAAGAGPPASATRPATASSKPLTPQPEASLMPFYMVMVCIAAGLAQFVQGQVANLRAAEADWDPSPKNMPDNQVIVMYCNG
ncbi:unnamed protein product [Amoebophrya sp. A120]|nr:unnamed protein product [Amoebophrya sp. A120]|eukprot:GSA120T00010477001.1